MMRTKLLTVDEEFLMEFHGIPIAAHDGFEFVNLMKFGS